MTKDYRVYRKFGWNRRESLAAAFWDKWDYWKGRILARRTTND